jgi:tetrahydromethanopterin S-methyltransferase subunit G
MNDTIVVALCSLIGTFGGIIASSKLVDHRLNQLEKKVEKHNNLVERMYKVEGRLEEIDTKIDLLHKEK